MHYFFKPAFYRKSADAVLFQYDILLELIKLPQFSSDKELKTPEDIIKHFEEENLKRFLVDSGVTRNRKTICHIFY